MKLRGDKARRGAKAWFLGAALAAAGAPLAFVSPEARAQGGALPPLPSASTTTSASALPTAPVPSSSAVAPPPSATVTPPPPPGDATGWQARYDAAGRRMTSGDFLGAIQEYSSLTATAPNEAMRTLALEQLRIASDYAARGTQPNTPPLPGSALPPPPSTTPFVAPPPTPRTVDRSRRTTDELVFLYLATPAYGFTTGFWVDSLITGDDGFRDTATVGSVFIGLGATGLSALSVALLDNAKVFKYGMPQAIFTGFEIGFGSGLGMAIWAGNRASTSFSTYRKFTTFVWGFSTAGVIAGAALGATVPTTPGRSAWVGTTAVTAGLLFGGIAGAATTDGAPANDEAARNFGITTAIAGIAGAGIGFVTAPYLAPSIARTRFIDLGWLSGGALGLAFCAAWGNDGRGCSERATFGALAAGAGLGFATGLLATLGMKPEALPEKDEPKKATFFDHMMPTVGPTEGGGMSVGIAGTL